MENIEIMNEGIENAMEEVVANEGTGIKPGAVALGVAGVALAVVAGVALAKKVYAAYKAKKETRKLEAENVVNAEDMAEFDEE